MVLGMNGYVWIGADTGVRDDDGKMVEQSVAHTQRAAVVRAGSVVRTLIDARVALHTDAIVAGVKAATALADDDTNDGDDVSHFTVELPAWRDAVLHAARQAIKK